MHLLNALQQWIYIAPSIPAVDYRELTTVGLSPVVGIFLTCIHITIDYVITLLAPPLAFRGHTFSRDGYIV